MGSETIRVDRNVHKKMNNTNFFVGLVYIVRTAGVLLLHHPVGKAVINYRHLENRVHEFGSLIYPGISRIYLRTMPLSSSINHTFVQHW